MKTFMIKTLAVIFAIIGSHSLKAQVACPYTIVNNLNCSVSMSIQFFDGSIASCPPCGAPVNIIVPANTPNFPVPCPCVPACNIAVKITGIVGPGACAMPYGSGTGTLANPFVKLPGLPPCCGGAGAHFIVNGNATHIMP